MILQSTNVKVSLNSFNPALSVLTLPENDTDTLNFPSPKFKKPPVNPALQLSLLYCTPAMLIGHVRLPATNDAAAAIVVLSQKRMQS